MKKSVWIFLFAVLLPSVVLGWLALRSAEEQQIVFERRTAELYQKETESLAVVVRDTVEAERRAFGDTVHRLLANGDPEALARDFTNTLADAWPVKAVGFAINKEGKLVSPSAIASSKNPEWRQFLGGNSSFLTSSEPAIVYNWQGDNQARSKNDSSRLRGYGNADSQMSRNDVAAVKPALKDSANDLKPASEAGGKMAGANGYAGGLLAQDKNSEFGDRRLATKNPADPASDGIAQAVTPAEGKLTQAPMKGLAAGSAPAPNFSATAAPAQAPPAPTREQEKAKSVQMAIPSPDDPTGRPESQGSAGAPAAAPVAPLALAKSDEVKHRPLPGTAPIGSAAQAKPQALATRDASQLRKELQAAAPSAVPQAMRKQMPQASAPMPQPVLVGKAEAPKDALAKDEVRADSVQKSADMEKNTLFAVNRQVEPQQLLNAPGTALSTIVPETTEFRSLTEEGDEGLVARFVQDKLNLIFWVRPPEAPEMVFGCLIEASHFADLWKDALERHRSSSRGSYDGSDAEPEYVLALLDDRGRPAAIQPASARARDWKHPFVASEIGEALPHWEAALYLASPTALADSARGLWRTLAFTIAGAVALIAFGGWLVVADARRQLALAQQKTDFVSNVSHELKTPLTSIRMFAELMHDRPQPAEKQSQYLRIITVEAERLTRLINNVLDFAKIGRKQRRYEKKPLDLHAVVARVWESQELHLREAGFTTRWEAAPGPYPVLGDDDALAQVLVNLLSNAEKYSTECKEVELHTWLDDGHVDIAVLDRGMGVPNGDDKKIFEAFYRAHDSLNSGIQGSGLGLTLAQRIAHEHGGEIRFERREGGGCRFTLRLPLAKKLSVTS